MLTQFVVYILKNNASNVIKKVSEKCEIINIGTKEENIFVASNKELLNILIKDFGVILSNSDDENKDTDLVMREYRFYFFDMDHRILEVKAKIRSRANNEHSVEMNQVLLLKKFLARKEKTLEVKIEWGMPILENDSVVLGFTSKKMFNIKYLFFYFPRKIIFEYPTLNENFEIDAVSCKKRKLVRNFDVRINEKEYKIVMNDGLICFFTEENIKIFKMGAYCEDSGFLRFSYKGRGYYRVKKFFKDFNALKKLQNDHGKNFAESSRTP